MSRPYFESTQVLKVFPSAYRKFDGGSKFTSEKNITNLIKSLAGGKGSFTIKDTNNTTTFPIVVDGYYFELDWNAVISAAGSAGNLWVKINVQQDYLLSFSTTTTLDDSNGFTALQYTTNPDSDSWFQILQDGVPVNTGYIPELVDDRGNWIDLTQIFDVTYDGSGNQIITIKEGALKFDNKTYVENFISQYATALSDSEGNTLSKGSTILPVYFSNGVPVAMNPTENIGYDTSTTSGIVPIWFDKDNGFKAISGTQGTSKKPIWVDGGAIKPISGTVGGTSKPIYLENGEFKEVSGSMSSAGVSTGEAGALAYYSDSTTISKFTGKGSNVQPIYIDSDGKPQTTTYSLNAKVSTGSSTGRLAYYNGTTTLQSYNSTTGGTNKPIYLSNGVPTEISVTAGVNMGTIGGTTAPGKAQSAIISGGVITGGQQIYVSTGARPTGISTNYKTGDIWFQIGS